MPKGAKAVFRSSDHELQGMLNKRRLMEILMGRGGEKTKPIQSQSPGIWWKSGKRRMGAE